MTSWFIVTWDITGNEFLGPFADEASAHSYAFDKIEDEGLDPTEVMVTSLELTPIRGLEEQVA